MDKRLQKYFIEGGIRMKMSFKANLDVKFEVKTKKGSRRKKNSWIKETFKWFSLIIIEYLFTELILKRLVALIIKIFTNGSFYFYNRMFYFGVKYG